MRNIAISLSGGGYRPSLFGLGALLYLVDAGKNREVTSISSVSGGLITNGYVAQLKGFARARRDTFRQDIRSLASTEAHETLWATPVVWLYLTFVVVSLFMAV